MSTRRSSLSTEGQKRLYVRASNPREDQAKMSGEESQDNSNCEGKGARLAAAPRSRLIMSRRGAALGSRLSEAGFLRAGDRIARDEDAVQADQRENLRYANRSVHHSEVIPRRVSSAIKRDKRSDTSCIDPLHMGEIERDALSAHHWRQSIHKLMFLPADQLV